MSLGRAPRVAAAWIVCSAFLSTAWAALPSKPDGYVTDAAGVLTDQTERGLEAVAAELDQKTGAQLAVVTVSSLDGETVDGAAEKLFRGWGIGRKEQDDGALFLMSVGDRQARIEVGYGLEGLIPDARAGRILDEQAIPAFRAGNMELGIARGALAIVSIIAADRGVTITGAPQRPAERPSQGSPFLGLLLMAILGYAVVRNPWLLLLLLSGGRGGGRGGGGGGFGGFGGFGGGSSGGGGASRGW